MIRTKVCSVCSEEKNIDSFSLNFKMEQNRFHTCKTCVAKTAPLVSDGRRKTCSICNVEKGSSEFPKRVFSPDGLGPSCRQCKSEKDKQYYAKNKEKVKEKVKQYAENNKDKVRISSEKYRKERKARDPKFKLDRKMSCAVYQDLRRCSLSKSERGWQDAVGYTLDQLKAHLESRFTPEMSWENYGTYWHVDHIRPKSWFTYTSIDDPQFRECWGLSNLQPLKASENMSKSDRFEG